MARRLGGFFRPFVLVVLAALLNLSTPAVRSSEPQPWSVESRPDVRINDPSQDAVDPLAQKLGIPNCNTQSEVGLAAWQGRVVAGWNDLGGGCLESRLGLPGISISGVGYSTDGGVSWTDGGALPAITTPWDGGRTLHGMMFGDPALAAGPDGTFFYASLAEKPIDPARGRSVIAVSRSTDGGATWQAPVDASPGRSVSAFQDKPAMAVDTTTSSHRGNVYLAWTESDAGAVRILVARSKDSASSFQVRELVASGANWGTDIAIGPAGEVYVAHIRSNLRLEVSRSTDGGETFQEVLSVGLNYLGVSDLTCVPERAGVQTRVLNGQIRVHNFPSLAVDTFGSADPDALDYNPYHGRIYLAIAQGIVADATNRGDVAFLWSADRGDTWVGKGGTVDRFLNDVRRNDQWHPQVEVDPRGSVLVTWYDRRLSAANADIDVFGALSTDGGASFSPNFRITDRSFPPMLTNPNAGLMGGCYMGDYNGLVSTGEGRFVAAWGDNRNSVVDASLPEPRAALPDPDIYTDVITISRSAS